MRKGLDWCATAGAHRTVPGLAFILLLLGASCANPGTGSRAGSASKGSAAFDAHRCGACHDASEGAGRPTAAPHPIRDPDAHPPSLEIAGSRYQSEWLRELLEWRVQDVPGWGDAAASSPEPSAAAANSGDARDAADLVAYLASRTDPARLVPASGIAFDPADSSAVSEGQRLYRSMGCPACHAIGGEGEEIGPRLDAAGRRLRTAYIAAAIRDPQLVRPGSEMPDLDLGDDAVRSLTAYLASLGR